jgi:V8-like Glu-specific endopeptidase
VPDQDKEELVKKKAGLGVFGVLALVALLIVVIMPGAGSGASSSNQDSAAADTAGVVGSSAAVTASAQARVLAYWTEERMRNAKPMALKAASGAAPSGQVSSDEGASPRSIKGSGRISKDEPPAVTSFGAEAAGYTYPFPFTRHAVDGSYLRYPYRTVGKIFFTQGTADFVCSGASVVSSPNNAVYTAGHCVSDGAGSFSTNVLFVPARKSGSNPYGTFAGTQLWTTSAWHFSGDLTGDFAAFAVGLNGAGNTLQGRVGTLGFSYDQSRVQHWDAFGYPAASPFTGGTMVTCKASHGADDTGIPGGLADPMGIGCDMTSGASGGPWITMLNRGSLLNSVNSYKYPSTQPGAMYGPYLGLLANQVRCAAATGGSTTC